MSKTRRRQPFEGVLPPRHVDLFCCGARFYNFRNMGTKTTDEALKNVRSDITHFLSNRLTFRGHAELIILTQAQMDNLWDIFEKYGYVVLVSYINGDRSGNRLFICVRVVGKSVEYNFVGSSIYEKIRKILGDKTHRKGTYARLIQDVLKETT